MKLIDFSTAQLKYQLNFSGYLPPPPPPPLSGPVSSHLSGHIPPVYLDPFPLTFLSISSTNSSWISPTAMKITDSSSPVFTRDVHVSLNTSRNVEKLTTSDLARSTSVSRSLTLPPVVLTNLT